MAKEFADTNRYKVDETYALVARIIDFRFLVCIANYYDLEIRHYNVKTVFLNRELERTIFMKMPEGFSQFMNENNEYAKNHILKLKRAIYGLKVSPKQWYVRFNEAMSKLRFRA